MPPTHARRSVFRYVALKASVHACESKNKTEYHINKNEYRISNKRTRRIALCNISDRAMDRCIYKKDIRSGHMKIMQK